MEQNRKPRKKKKKKNNLQLHGQLIFDKARKNIQREKRNLFNKWCWGKSDSNMQKMKLNHFLTPNTHTHTHTKSKWSKT